MPDKTDKVILTNLEALRAKYGSAGLKRINSAIDNLIARDKQRGLKTTFIALDDGAIMKKFGTTAVNDPSSPRQNKEAIDDIYKSLAPDYIVLLGSIDVIPHQDLHNPLYDPSPSGDPDRVAFGDLPYACEAGYSQKAHDFFGPTRVVGRLPDLTGGKDPAYVLGLLETAKSFTSATPGHYHQYFGISAQIWDKSTTLSLTHTFGAGNTPKDVPPNNDKWLAQFLGGVSHFINCHGASVSSQFYGQPSNGKSQYPVALDAAYVNGKISEGTVAAAECCYGGQLYDPALLKGQQSVCNTYLANKAYGFFASTTIAYGPSDSNAQADLICQYFLQSVLRGASLGRAALEARQKFVRAASPPDPSDVKTLAQFNLYGDPSITPIKTPSPAVGLVTKDSAKLTSTLNAERVERLDRRKVLFRVGVSLAATEPRPRRLKTKPRPTVQRSLHNKARELGITPSTTLCFEVLHPIEGVRMMPKGFRSRKASRDHFYVVFGETDREQSLPVVKVVALVAKESGGELVSVSKVESR
jgi:Peptidase family C25